MNRAGTIFPGIILLIGGLGITTNSMAESEDRTGYGRHHMVHGEQMGNGRHHSPDDMHHRGRSGKGGEWKRDLSDNQRKEVDKLKLTYKKQKYLLKSKIKQAKVELALLVTVDSPDQSAINKKIDQISTLKSEKLHLKTDHKIQVRKILTPEQRVKFDMAVLKKAYKGRKKGYRR